jgi:hypothetical protein
MVVYASNVFHHKIFRTDIANLSLNIAMLSVCYAILGAFVSFVYHFMFDNFDDGWKKKTPVFQIFDVAFEIAMLALIAFWSVFTINTSAPIFPVRRELAAFVDTYTSGMFFIYAVFLFMDDLSAKIKHLYETYLDEPMRRILPTHGSILDLTLRYSS